MKTSVLGISISEWYTTKMAFTAQQVDNAKEMNMNYVS